MAIRRCAGLCGQMQKCTSGTSGTRSPIRARPNIGETLRAASGAALLWGGGSFHVIPTQASSSLGVGTMLQYLLLVPRNQCNEGREMAQQARTARVWCGNWGSCISQTSGRRGVVERGKAKNKNRSVGRSHANCHTVICQQPTPPTLSQGWWSTELQTRPNFSTTQPESSGVELFVLEMYLQHGQLCMLRTSDTSASSG